MATKNEQTGVETVARRLRTGPQIHPSAHLAPNATVIGEVSLGAEASVWYQAVLRGDINRIAVGPRSNIQDGAIVHVSDEFPALVGELVTVGHAAVIHACTIADEVLIGMGAIVLDGAEIGARSIIGARALVTAGMKVPPGSLVLGAPGRVVRQLSGAEQQALQGWALKYVEVAKRYRSAQT
ncbi:MAG: gamma carbonic anhydrase family protein [Verrucomicrobiota bacterium]|nr:gamma carbonic anhydrase family protein [Chthoniobacterales bacterium]MDQ3115307.1 gamma carbonic anhydrase family protein [Verrucomicrobiota bacterium]